MKIWSLYTRIKQNIYCNADLLIHHPLSQLPKQCEIEMTCISSWKKGKQAFNNKKFRKADAAKIQCSPCPNVIISHQNNKQRKKCQQLDQQESSMNVFPICLEASKTCPKTPEMNIE